MYIYFQFIYFMLVCTLHDNTQPVFLSFLKVRTIELSPVLGMGSPIPEGDGNLIVRTSRSARSFDTLGLLDSEKLLDVFERLLFQDRSHLWHGSP